MSKSKRKRYTPEYKRELVDLVHRSESSCRQIALEVGVNPNQLSRWVREAKAGSKVFPGIGTPREEEITRLKRELSKVTKERDFSYGPRLQQARGRASQVRSEPSNNLPQW